MKLIITTITFCALLLVGCNGAVDEVEESRSASFSSAVQSEAVKTVPNNESEPTSTTMSSSPTSTSVDPVDDLNYEQALVDFVGADYLEGKALMRANNEEIQGKTCAVFQLGISTAGKFTTEQWLAVDFDGIVYKYDVVIDEWSEFTSPTEVSIADCLHMLNEVLRDQYGAEYESGAPETKQGIYLTERDSNHPSIIPNPDMLILDNEPIPEGYFADPAAVSYIPVTNFASKANIHEHLSHYFTESYLEMLQYGINENFFEYEGELYLVRGGRGYGANGLDLDSVDYTNMQNDMLIVDLTSHGSVYAKGTVGFTEDNGTLKISSFQPILMYDLYAVNPEDGAFVLVPDLSAFESGNQLPTPYDQITLSETKQNTFEVTHFGDYQDVLSEYTTFLTQLDFVTVSDVPETLYSLESIQGDYNVRVHMYLLDEEGVRVEMEIVKNEG